MCSHYQTVKERERCFRHFGVQPPVDKKRMVVVLPPDSYDTWLNPTQEQSMARRKHYHVYVVELSQEV